MLTSRDPRWKRDDVAARLLPIRMQTIIGTKATEAQLQRDILERRNCIFGSLLNLLNLVISNLRQNSGKFGSGHRLADFDWFGSLASTPLGVADAFREAMQTLNRQQLDLLAEDDERVELLGQWAEAKPKGWTKEKVLSSQLFTELRENYRGPERHFPFKSVTAMGTWLGRSAEVIRHKLKLSVANDSLGHARAWSLSRTRCEAVHSPKSLANCEKAGLHTFTPDLKQTLLAKPEEVITDEA
jgi:hypothetical protein